MYIVPIYVFFKWFALIPIVIMFGISAPGYVSALLYRKAFEQVEAKFYEEHPELAPETDPVEEAMQEAMKNHQQEPLSMDDVTAMIVGQVGQLLPMDEETSDQFQQLAKKMIELAGKETKIDGGNHDVTTKRSSM